LNRANPVKKKWLCWYASQFPITEINGSFYRTTGCHLYEGCFRAELEHDR